jgi:hypothetical protein
VLVLREREYVGVIRERGRIEAVFVARGRIKAVVVIRARDGKIT